MGRPAARGLSRVAFGRSSGDEASLGRRLQTDIVNLAFCAADAVVGGIFAAFPRQALAGPGESLAFGVRHVSRLNDDALPGSSARARTMPDAAHPRDVPGFSLPL